MKTPQPQQLIATLMRMVRYGDRLNASRDWLVLLSVFLVVFVGSVAWNIVSLFQTLSKDPTSYVQTTTTTIEKDAVETLKELLLERESRRAGYGNDTSFVDPSGE